MVRVAIAALLAGALVPLAALAQGGASRPAARALPGLPSYTAGYASWRRINRAPIPPRRAGDAHLSTKNVYASRRPVGGRYPYGTVIVKEGVRPGSRFVGLIAVMRKVRGASPRNNNWVMIEWVRETRGARFGEIARGQVCYACHVGARANDYVFTR
ncbi:MAG: cytochrome P460 family protein [Actinobacteria bacterium]|nr:cytochrome P460 family protein [Actinomycetota bacterium]